MNSTLMSFASGLTDYLLYASIIAAVLITIAWSVIKLGRVKAPVYNHMVWLCTLFAVLILPIVFLYAPKVAVPVLPAQPKTSVALTQGNNTYASSGLIEDRRLGIHPSGPSVNALPVESHKKLPALISVKNILACLWAVGFLFMLVRFLIDWYRVKRIMRLSEPLPGDLLPRDIFPTRLKLLLSAQIGGPLCLGIFRPVILLPKKMCSNGMSEDLMMVLGHELAHVERRDWLVNIFQRIIEAVLFFHPLIWYASAQLTHEREILCDHHVIAKGVAPTDYIEMLTKVLEQGFERNSLNAVALFEGRNLLSRVRTLLKAGNKIQLKASRTALIASIMIILLFMALGTIRLEAKSADNNQKTETVTSDKAAELIEIAKKEDFASVSAALNNGEDVNEKNKNDKIALNETKEVGHADIVQMLEDASAKEDATPDKIKTNPDKDTKFNKGASKGADVNAKNSDSRTAILAANDGGQAGVQQVEKAGAKEEMSQNKKETTPDKDSKTESPKDKNEWLEIMKKRLATMNALYGSEFAELGITQEKLNALADIKADEQMASKDINDQGSNTNPFKMTKDEQEQIGQRMGDIHLGYINKIINLLGEHSYYQYTQIEMKEIQIDFSNQFNEVLSGNEKLTNEEQRKWVDAMSKSFFKTGEEIDSEMKKNVQDDINSRMTVLKNLQHRYIDGYVECAKNILSPSQLKQLELYITPLKKKYEEAMDQKIKTWQKAEQQPSN
jgi:beta-lactamase regulating signal transducer with metallopeptidase domain